MSTAKSKATVVRSSNRRQYLTFMLGGEEYGVDILRVQEIKGWDNVTRIPHTPDFVVGVINLRGCMVPIVDLRRRFGLDTTEFGRTTVVIVVKAAVEKEERTVGMVVDAVSEVYDVDGKDTKPPPDLCGNIDTIFVQSLATIDEKMIILLDIDKLIGNSIDAARTFGTGAVAA